jgi:hypothetical protein
MDGSSIVLVGQVRDQPPDRSLVNWRDWFTKPTGSFDLLRVTISGDTVLKAPIPTT